MNRIAAKFSELKRAGKKAFIPYITAGDPNLEATLQLLRALERNGADIIELGVPFSDPMADGVIIQRASERALKNRVAARDCLEVVRRLRESSEVPIVLFSYLNPLLAIDELGAALRQAGVDGVLVTDLAPEEAGEHIQQMRAAAVETIFLVAPTSSEARLKIVAEVSTGFVYAVSRAGVTGVRESLSEAAANLVERLRRVTDLPVAVGFGVSTPEQVAQVWRHADAAVVGSRLVAEIEACAADADGFADAALVERIGALTRTLTGRR